VKSELKFAVGELKNSSFLKMSSSMLFSAHFYCFTLFKISHLVSCYENQIEKLLAVVRFDVVGRNALQVIIDEVSKAVSKLSQPIKQSNMLAIGGYFANTSLTLSIDVALL
jgi:hypothetical protein